MARTSLLVMVRVEIAASSPHGTSNTPERVPVPFGSSGSLSLGNRWLPKRVSARYGDVITASMKPVSAVCTWYVDCH